MSVQAGPGPLEEHARTKKEEGRRADGGLVSVVVVVVMGGH